MPALRQLGSALLGDDGAGGELSGGRGGGSGVPARRGPHEPGPGARAYGGGPWTQRWRVRLRAALPGLLAGLPIAAAAAMLGAIVGEYLGAESGLGVAMINSQQSLAVERTWGIALVATDLSGAAYGLTALVGNWLTPWVPRTPR